MSWEIDHKKRVAAFPSDVRDAHARSSNHRDKIVSSKFCGCFHCGSTFPPADIVEWIDEGPDGKGQTAMCPKCGIDSVIGDKSGFDLSAAFLARMKAHWF
jgi:hypothetical protein